MREKKLTEKQLYTAKLEELRSRYSEVDPLIFYRELFPAGSFEEQGSLTGKPNGVLVAVDDTGIGKQRLLWVYHIDFVLLILKSLRRLMKYHQRL